MVLKKELEERSEKTLRYLEEIYDRISDTEFKITPMEFPLSVKNDIEEAIGILSGHLTHASNKECRECMFLEIKKQPESLFWGLATYHCIKTKKEKYPSDEACGMIVESAVQEQLV